MKFIATKLFRLTHLSLGMLLHYLGAWEIEIADILHGRKCKQIVF